MSNSWRESLQEKYGNHERNDPYEYHEWRDGMKHLLFSFQREVDELRKNNQIEMEKDYRTMLEISQNENSEKERNKKDPEKENMEERKKEISKKRKYEF